MHPRGVDFVGIAVADIGAAKEFYGGKLGLGYLGDFGERWAEYDAGNVAVSLYHDEGAAAGEPVSRNATVAFAVPDVRAAVEELRREGSRVLQEVEEYPPCFMATVTDPFGNTVMLHQRKDGTAG